MWEDIPLIRFHTGDERIVGGGAGKKGEAE